MHVNIVQKKAGKTTFNMKFKLDVLAPALALVKALTKDKVDLNRLIESAGENSKTNIIAGSNGKNKKEGIFVFLTK